MDIELRKFDYARDEKYGYIMQPNMDDGQYTLSEDVKVLQDRLTAAERHCELQMGHIERLSSLLNETHNECDQLRAQLAEQATPAESVANNSNHLVAWDGQLIEARSFVIEITMKIAKERDDALEKLRQLESKVEQVSGGGEPVQWVCEHANNPWPNGGGKRFDTKEQAYHYIISEFNVNHYNAVIPIYREKPSPNKADVPSDDVIYHALDYIRCGIGCNYSDNDKREQLLEKYRDPIANYFKQIKPLPPLKDE